MGLFDFVKNAGAKIGIGKSTSEEAEEKAGQAAAAAAARAKGAAAAAERQVASEKKEQVAEVRKSFELEKHVRSMGFEVDDLDITFDDGKATITGAVDDNATRERVILTVGNVDGVGQVDDQLRVKTHVELAAEEINRQKAETKFYTVVSGDSLSKIAKEFYGDPMRYPEIFEANKPMLKDPDLIYPGQVLRIPGAGGAPESDAAPKSGGESRNLKGIE